jgi:hypothetical protein
MNLLWSHKRSLLALLLGLIALGVTACASTDDSDNASVRPWNSPKGWENGLPSNMTEGR